MSRKAFEVRRIIGAAEDPSGNLRVKIQWKKYPNPTWVDLQHATGSAFRIRQFLRRVEDALPDEDDEAADHATLSSSSDDSQGDGDGGPAPKKPHFVLKNGTGKQKAAKTAK